MEGILIASFGTTHKDTYTKNIKALGEVIQAYCPQSLLVHAFTSSMVRKVLEQRGQPEFSPTEALEYLLSKGVTHVTVQGTHLLEGIEFNKLLNDLTPFQSKFASMKLGLPLLSSTSSLKESMDVIAEKYPASHHEGVLLMGHGSQHEANRVYKRFNTIAHDTGQTHLYMATVEASPTLQEGETYFKGRNITNITLVPYMLVAGDHAKNDLLGSKPTSWKSLLTEKGYNVTGVEEGLGECPEIRELYLKHFKQAQELIKE